MSTAQSRLVQDVRACALMLENGAEALDPLLRAVGESRFVLLGESSQGTHEFYAMRAEITRRLIEEKGFTAVIVEADWPDAYRVNRYVRGFHDDEDAVEALGGFKRFPQWMWRNTDVVAFIEWLRERNAAVEGGAVQAGFYGMDLYSLYASIEAVLKYLGKTDPAEAARARERYACFGAFTDDPHAYGYAAGFGMEHSCEEAVVQQLMELRRHAAAYARRDGRRAQDDYFQAEQNARLVRNAEEYYRSMFRGRVSSWNLRDRHMVETIQALTGFLDRMQPGRSRTKAVIWAHNSHLGDARATDMGAAGELNVGQLLRESEGPAAFLVGFTMHAGTVTAASDWDGPAEVKAVRPSLEGSYERLFHETRLPRFLLPLRDAPAAAILHEQRLERAIGVIYRPGTERLSHYFQARLPEQFDAVIHIDQTEAVKPLEVIAAVEPREVEETFPTGV